MSVTTLPAPLSCEKVTLCHLLTQQRDRLGLTKSAIDSFVAESQITRWQQGDRIVVPEDAHDLLHFIVAGVLKVTCQGPIGMAIIVQFARPGQFVHTGWLFERQPRRR